MKPMRQRPAIVRVARGCLLGFALLTNPAPLFANPPLKIAALDLCGDHYLAALKKQDAEDRLAILFSPFASSAYGPAGLPDSAPVHRKNYESLLLWQPDLVVGQSFQSPALKKFLARHKIEFFAVPADVKELSEISAAFRDLGARVGMSEAVRQRSIELDAIFNTPVAEEERALPTALYLRPGGGSGGPNTFVDLALRAGGFANWQKRAGWRAIDLETLALTPPPDILILSFTALHKPRFSGGLFSHPLLTRIEQRFSMPGRNWVCPAPNLAGAIKLLREKRKAMTP